MWTSSIYTEVACNEHSKNLIIGPTVATSTWQPLPNIKPMPIISPAVLLGAVVRTTCASNAVSMISSQATGALASGLIHYIDVDQKTGQLIINPEFLKLKDFVKTAFSGILGAAMAYLRMLHEGYCWFGHYEESLFSPLSPSIAQPDFVFTDGTKLVIVEAKGTAKDLKVANHAAKRAYLKQIHTATYRILVGGISPSEGYVFGTALNLPHTHLSSAIEMACIHQTFSSTNDLKSTQPSNKDLSAFLIQQLNYKNALLQLGLSYDNIPTPHQQTDNNNELYIGPELVRFKQGKHVFTAAVAIPHNLLQNISNLQAHLKGKQLLLEKPIFETLEILWEEFKWSQDQCGISIEQDNKDNPNRTYVKFPDNVYVVIDKTEAK